ncbi:guanine nucleotide-binding protein subunit gamma-1 isoform X2 [Eurytemora carolleeae]|uniref:guanine nucleotide-binding protein subunit gamma-1 isoform X2 n=1 Tax=Eurytemora carolleeae TaxID=1294199 RepID=UPI000C75E1B5|nr:guanine nucleotide-binding protein subunit gamma-1 isoform X2 [Eurytemora carolleeae]|eukprot:XP_023344586.1 guanine nucleotide-binding protein subunit gamma-1-like isoform X2 [Eurytemora affinis]
MTNMSDLHLFRVTTLQHEREVVQQLRREANIKRINVSQAAEDIKRFVNQHQPEDFLLMGFPSVKSNPFREKSSCTAL